MLNFAVRVNTEIVRFTNGRNNLIKVRLALNFTSVPWQ